MIIKSMHVYIAQILSMEFTLTTSNYTHHLEYQKAHQKVRRTEYQKVDLFRKD